MVDYIEIINFEKFQQAESLFDEYKIEEACDLLRELSLEEPENIVIKLKYAITLSKLKNFKLAINELESAKRIIKIIKNDKRLSRRINLIPIMYEYARLQISVNNHLEAKRVLDEINREKYDSKSLICSARIEVDKGNYKKALEYYNKVLLFDPNNSDVVSEKALMEIYVNNYEKAYQILENSKLTKNSLRANDIMINILVRQGKYEEAYKKHIDILENFFTQEERKKDYIKKNRGLIFFLKYKLGKLSQKEIREVKEKNDSRYLYKQIVDYSPELAKEHIRKHLSENSKKTIHSIFNNDVDIDELYEYMSEKIQNLMPTNIYFEDDVYIISMNKKIGKYNNHDLSYILVSTIPNTKKILTIYPTTKTRVSLPNPESNLLEEQYKTNKVQEDLKIAKDLIKNGRKEDGILVLRILSIFEKNNDDIKIMLAKELLKDDDKKEEAIQILEDLVNNKDNKWARKLLKKYKNENKEMPKINKLIRESQIEKFNRRYNK